MQLSLDNALFYLLLVKCGLLVKIHRPCRCILSDIMDGTSPENRCLASLACIRQLCQSEKSSRSVSSTMLSSFLLLVNILVLLIVFANEVKTIVSGFYTDEKSGCAICYLRITKKYAQRMLEIQSLTQLKKCTNM